MAATRIRSAIVTGAGGGLGKAIAIEFLKQNFRVAIVDNNRSKIDTTSSELSALGEVLPLHADITDADAVKDLFEKTISAFGQVDALVNCAGIHDQFQGVHELDMDDYYRCMAVNINAPVLLSKYAVQEFLREGRSQKGGSIVNIASIAALRGNQAGVSYTTSKSAVVGLTRNTASTYKHHGITCNAILPGGMKTPMVNEVKTDNFGIGWAISEKNMLNMPRWVDIHKIGRLACFLSGEDGQDISGQLIAVDGGWMTT